MFAFKMDIDLLTHALVQAKQENKKQEQETPSCVSSHMQPDEEVLTGMSPRSRDVLRPALRHQQCPGEDKLPPGPATAGDITGDKGDDAEDGKGLAQPGSHLGVYRPDREAHSQTEPKLQPKKTGGFKAVLHQPGWSMSPASQHLGHQRVTQSSSPSSGCHEVFRGSPSLSLASFQLDTQSHMKIK